MYRIRFHGRGGQGIKTASRMLGTALFHEGWEVQDAPLYGAERRGAPIFASVRADHKPINERGLIATPDLLVVTDETLIPIPAANVLHGVTKHTIILLNSSTAGETWRSRLGLDCEIVTVQGGAGCEAPTQIPYVGATCAAAAARLLGQVTRESLARGIIDELPFVEESLVAANLSCALAAFDALDARSGIVSEGAEPLPGGRGRPEWIALPFEAADISAPDVFAPLTSVQIMTGAWRTTRPVIDPVRCNRCSWICSTLCPDSAIAVTADGRPEIDLDHCKGCLICVAVCPHHAISAVPEHPRATEESHP